MQLRTVRTLLAVLFLAQFAGACDMSDLREDPNNPTEASENAQLTALLGNFSYEVVGNDPARITNMWIQQLAFNGVPPSEDNYAVDESVVNNLWEFYSYTDVMMNARRLNEQATANGNFAYAGIAKIILAWDLGIMTDLFGDIPYSKAFDVSNTTPEYDTQKQIYDTVFQLLDGAIEDFGKESIAAPGSDDLLYQGNLARWERLAYGLKARFHLHLTKAPGENANAHAQAALEAAQQSFQSNTDNANFGYDNAPGAENPWYQWVIDGKWDTRNQLSSRYVDMLKTKRDPRLFVQARQAGAVDATGLVPDYDPVPTDADSLFDLENTIYLGHINGTNGIGADFISSVGEMFSAADAPLVWFNYPEVKFIEAEATLILQGPAAAQPVYEEAILASMDMHDVRSADATAYVASRPKLTDAGVNPIEELMLEKQVANFLSLENYNDWRRNGVPDLEPVTTQPYAEVIPLRFPYPSSELTRNAANVEGTGVPRGFDALPVPVWWDSAP